MISQLQERKAWKRKDTKVMAARKQEKEVGDKGTALQVEPPVTLLQPGFISW